MSAQLNYTATPKLMRDGGIGWFLVVVCYTAMVGFIAANTYHTDNFLSTMLAVVEGTVFSFVVSYISFALCLSEIPLSKSIVTDYRFNDDRINFKIVMKSFLGVAIACLAMAGTLNSQKMNASLIDSEVSSHQSQSSSYEADKKALDSQWRSDIRRANKIKNTDDRNIKISDINTQYYKDLSALNKSKSKHQATKPAQSYQVGSLGHTITSALLAFVCSFGLMFVSGFLTVYHYPITPKALMSLRTKKDHDYSSDASNIQMMNHQLSPLVQGVVFSWFAKRFMGESTPPPATEKQAISSDQNYPAQNRPQPTKSTVRAVSTPTVDAGVRTPNDEPKQGAKFRAINEGDIEEAKRAVMAGNLSPTIKPVKDWLLKVRRVGISDTARQDNARKLLNGMFKEGILILNPEQQFTKQTLAKYVLASNVKSEQSSTRKTDSVLNADYSNASSRDVSKGGAPYWLEEAVEMEHNQVPYFVFDDVEGGVYRLAILSPDQQETLCEFATLNAEEMADELREDENGNKPEKYTVFLNALKQYRSMQK